MKSVVTENVTYYLTMKFDDFNQHIHMRWEN